MSGSRIAVILFVLGAVACQANASIHASTSADAKTDDTATTTTTPEPAQPAPPPAPTTATPANVCPLHCYEARGADHAAVSNEELGQIAPAIEPALAKMRACTPPDAWRLHGSPTIHLRIEPDGVVHEVDVDPHHHFGDYACIEDAGRSTSIALSLPGRKAVRCTERCEVPRATKAKRRGR
jgi:hypothetical protein